MTTVSAWLTGAHIAGIIAILVGLIDAWAFHSTFTIDADKALVLSGLVWLGGLAVPTVTTAVANARTP